MHDDDYDDYDDEFVDELFSSTNDNEEPDDEDKWHSLHDNDEPEDDPEDEWYRQHECDDSDLLDDDGFEDRYGHY